jgi:hypothetical protein
VPSAGSADTAGTANSIGGKTAASLQVKCPAGTVASGGVCIELTQRTAKDWNQAYPGLSGTEWSSDLFDATTLGVIDMSTGIVSGSANTPHPYRCMTTPAN